MFKRQVVSLFLIIINYHTHAEIVTDGTLGNRINLQAPNYQITQDLGTTVGSNLFHSFEQFNIYSGETATFSGTENIQNVISRVTGGNASTINGTLRNSIPNANTYLINPYGIMFGSNAQLDVQGSFHASTADYLTLGENGQFDARNPENTILTVAPIKSFGFLSNSPTSLSVNGSQLNTSKGNISLIGGDLSIKNAHIQTSAGQIYLASVGKMGDVILSTTDFSTPSLQGDISISEHSEMEGKSVFIRSGQFVMDNSTINSNALGNQKTGRIDVNANTISLRQGATISSHSENSGKGADIHLNATDYITVEGENNEGQSSSLLVSAGADENDTADAGQISLYADKIVFKEGGAIRTENFGSGHSAHINLTANDSVLLTGSGSQQDGYPTAIVTITHSQQDNASQGGNAFIGAERIDVTDNADISLFTVGKGQSGSIHLKAKDIFMDFGDVLAGSAAEGHVGSIKLEVGNQLEISKLTYILNISLGAGNAGMIDIQAKNILLKDGSFVTSTTRRTGNAGDIYVNAMETLTLEGAEDGWSSIISSETNPTQEGFVGGKGGHIRIKAGKLSMKDGTLISTSSYSRLGFQAGAGGDIDIDVRGTIDISGVNPYGENGIGFATGIHARSVGVGENGSKGGNIQVQAQSLNITEGGAITSSTDNHAPGGTVDILVEDNVSISGDASNITLQAPTIAQLLYLEEYSHNDINQSTSGIYASSEDDNQHAGAAGHIHLTARNLVLTNKGTISTSSAGGGKAGNINLNVKQLQMDNSANIASENALSNRYQFADLASRDKALVVRGDVIEVADLGTGKAGHYINLGNYLIQTRMPLDAVSNLNALNELSEQYRLFEGQIVKVQDIGHGEPANYIYTRHRRLNLHTWQRMNSDVTTFLDNPQSITAVRKDVGYEPDELLPNYQLGERIRVKNMGDGKSADFIYTMITDPADNWKYVRFVRVNQFNLTDSRALNTLSEQISFQDQHPIATVNNNGMASQFIYADNQWIAFNNQHQVQHVSEMNTLTLAKTGNIAEVANNNQSMIYTGQHWITLNPQQSVVQTLAELEQLPAQPGDLVKVSSENYFYAEGQWLKQEKGGDAGTINIKADTLRIAGKGAITTEAMSGGGGGITLNVDNLIFLNDGQVSTSVQEGAGNGGNLIVTEPQFLILNNAKLIAQAYEGQGGNIHIVSDNFVRSPCSEVSASSKLGIDGNVKIDSPDETVSGDLIQLSSGLERQEHHLKTCKAKVRTERSRFTIKRLEGVPLNPEDLRNSGLTYEN